MAFADVLDNSGKLCLLRLVNQVGQILTLLRAIRRNRHDIQLVNLVQLSRFGLSRTGHTGQLVVEAEVVLERNGCQRLVLVFNLHPFLGLNCLVHALVIATACQHTTGELIDNEDLTITNNVILVAGEQLLGLQGIVQVTDQRRVFRSIQVGNTQLILNEFNTLFTNTDGALTLIDFVVNIALHTRHNLGERQVPVRIAICRTGNN